MALLWGASIELWARSMDGGTPGGVVITNQAQATYSDGSGETYSTSSDTVTITVLAVASVTVSPD